LTTNSYRDYELIYYINDVTIDNEEVLVEYGAVGTATGTYEYGLQRLSVEHVNEAKEYYLYNGTGNVTQTTAENGSMFLRYTYNGEDYDYNTGLQYLRARYYSTGTGNFISQDTYLGNLLNPLSQNRYTYCGNNPVMYDDPSGHFFMDLAFMGGGLYFAYTSAVEAHDYYQETSAPLIEDLTRMAEEAKTVDTCGVEWVNMPDNVIFDESTGMYLSFGCAAQAELYQQKLAMLQELKSQLYSAYAHAILDAISSIPGIGALGDIGNAILYAIEGDYANAAMSGVSAIFGLDDLMKIMKNPASFLDFFKLGKKGGKAATEALGLADNADGVLNQTDEFLEAAADTAKQGDAALDASKHMDDNLLDSVSDTNGKPGLSVIDDTKPAGKPDSPNRPTCPENGVSNGGTVPDFYVGPNGKALPSQYKDWIGTNIQKDLLDQAENPQLQNAINQLYRGNSFIGDGGTADVIRFEQQTGLMLGKNGGSHVQKGIEMAKYIENKILTLDLSPSDRALATQLLEDLYSALGR